MIHLKEGFSGQRMLVLPQYILEACNLLDNTDMKINQVSYKVGFEDNLYFSRIFSKIMAMSPREYKKMVKG